MTRRLFKLAIVAGVGLLPALAGAEEPLFPFVISYDAPDNAVNVSAWLPRPAGGHGFLRTAEGRLADDQGPVRLWATNFCFEANFPEHDAAERVAARLARLGINCVRMHHMDSRNIWGQSPNKLTIDPAMLERMDYLVSQFKQHGVYVDLNLHVSRTLGAKEGFPAEGQTPKYDKGLDNFEPRMIEAQKQYARDLLTHVNPYTKTAYAQEPAVAVIEINNENALYTTWNKGDLDVLPEPYATTYRKLWNGWLRRKYGGTEQLKKAWSAGEQPLGDEQIADPHFDRPLGKPWYLQRDQQSQCEARVQAASGPEGKNAVTLRIDRGGREAYIPQFYYSGVKVQKGQAHTLSFWLKVDKARSIGVNCMMAHEPWHRLGLSATVAATPQWKQYRYTFVAGGDDDDARISFSQLGLGTVELAEVSFRSGGVVGLARDQRLEDDSVPPVAHRGDSSSTESARADFADFMYDTEHAYWLGMYHFLKDELQVRSLVSGTQMGYGPATIQAELDYIDDHSYWQHPHFPGKPWDPHNWDVRNVALVNTPAGTLSGLAGRRVAGRAYTISEYNHPAPNQFAAEGFPMIAAFGAFQGWDGVFSFAYCHSPQYEPRKIDSYFNINGHTGKLAHMPACAAMFLRGDVAPARSTCLAPMPAAAERAELRASLNARNLQVGTFGLEPLASLVHAVALDLAAKPGAAVAKCPGVDPDATSFVSDTGQIRWDVSRPGKGFFTVDAPRSKLFTGFVDGRSFKLGAIDVAIGPTRLDWCTLSMVCLDGPGFDRPGRVLIAATGLVENAGMRLETLKDDRVTLGTHWGDEPVMCEGVPVDLLWPAGNVELYSLDESGNRRQQLKTGSQGGRSALALRPEARTVWYELVVK